MPTQLPRALTIAGSDSGGGAGIQADLKTFCALGVYGASVITAVTAQNTKGVQAVYPMTAEQVAAQLDSVLSDIGATAAKTGMLHDAAIIAVVADRVRRHRVPNLVVDPVMLAKDGRALLQKEALTLFQERLIPLGALITPNVPEAEVLTEFPVRSQAEMVAAGRRLLSRGARAALVKGGHLEGWPADDVLVTPGEVLWFRGERVPGRSCHGTGCTFSAAIAAGLARGLALSEAIGLAKRFIAAAIRTAPAIGSGHGPTNHLAWAREEQP